MRLVYFSPVPWASFSQRPHKFVEWFHLRHGADVLWIEPYPTRLPTWHDFRRLRSGWNAGGSAEPRRPEWITVVRPFGLPVDPIIGLDRINGLLWQRVFVEISNFLSDGDLRIIAVGKPSKLALRTLQCHSKAVSFLDAMDDYPEFYTGRSKCSMESVIDEIASRVSRVLISSEALSCRFERQQSKLLLVRNACDTNTMPPVCKMRHEPGNDEGRPILGYVGTIGHWFDWTLLLDLAKANPSVHVRLLGPAYAPPPEPVPGNVELLTACGHAVAMEAVRSFTAGLIPFKNNDLTRSVDPIKYYEYRSLGLPVLSSRFGEMASREGEPGIFIMDGSANSTLQVQRALNYRYDEDEVRRFRDRNSWTRRFDESRLLPD